MIFSSPYADVAIPDVSLPQFISERFAALGDTPAIIDSASGHTLSFAQILDGTRRMAFALAQRGFTKGQVFAICCPNAPEYPVAILAVTTLGGIVTTMNPLSTGPELNHQLRLTGARFLLTAPALGPRMAEATAGSAVQEIFVLGAAPFGTPYAALLQEDGAPPAVVIDARNDLAVLPFSSGTSGVPKGVMLSHRNLVAQLCQSERVSHDEPNPPYTVSVLPFFHIYGLVLILMLALRRGRTLVSMARFELEPFLANLQKYRVMRASLVPPIVQALAKHPLVDGYDLSSLRIIGCGAAPLSPDIERLCKERIGSVVNQGYGMTETSGAALNNPEMLDGMTMRPGTIGICWPNMQAKVVDVADGRELGPGERGELCLRGPNVMRGYFKAPEATAQTLDPDGWLHTGDVAVADADGYFRIVDRIKELIKHNAYQIAPAELEGVLMSHPAVADAAVIPSPDEESGEVPKAFVVLKSPCTADELMAYVAARVAPYKKIRLVQFVESLPRSASGKLLRRVLVDQERVDQERHRVPPR